MNQSVNFFTSEGIESHSDNYIKCDCCGIYFNVVDDTRESYRIYNKYNKKFECIECESIVVESTLEF